MNKELNECSSENETKYGRKLSKAHTLEVIIYIYIYHTTSICFYHISKMIDTVYVINTNVSTKLTVRKLYLEIKR